MVTKPQAPPRVGVVVLTQGTRPADLKAGLDSVLAQVGAETDVVVVGNGWTPVDLPEGVRGRALPRNLGIPAGRNAGVDDVAGDFLLFLDDDARLGSNDYLLRTVGLMRSDPRIALVHPRVTATEGDAPRRWIPRVRKGDPGRSSVAFALWEGATVVRRDVFEAAGRWPEAYLYAHEGIELIWRVWDTGHRCWYAGDIVAVHPPIDPARHDTYYRFNARHRVWLARRNLPLPFRWLYVATWTLVQIVRSARDPQVRSGSRSWWAGWREGWRSDPGPSRTLRWSTIWTMTRHGRPPVV